MSIASIGIGASALAGVERAQAMATSAASDLAQGLASPGGPDLVGDLVTLSTAQVQESAAVQVERAAQQQTRALLSAVI